MPTRVRKVDGYDIEHKKGGKWSKVGHSESGRKAHISKWIREGRPRKGKSGKQRKAASQRGTKRR